jgi:hypothetical protein
MKSLFLHGWTSKPVVEEACEGEHSQGRRAYRTAAEQCALGHRPAGRRRPWGCLGKQRRAHAADLPDERPLPAADLPDEGQLVPVSGLHVRVINLGSRLPANRLR